MKIKSISTVALAFMLSACGGAKSDKGSTGRSKEVIDATKIESMAKPVEIVKQEVPADYGYIVNIGDRAPLFSTEIAYGGEGKITPETFKGKVVMIQFTASWCSVCRKEMPHIEKDIWQKHKDNKDFVLLGIDKDEDRETIVKFSEQTGITYPVVFDPAGKIFELYADKKAGITRNVIIDRDGKIVYMTRLYKEKEYSEMVSVIDNLLK